MALPGLPGFSLPPLDLGSSSGPAGNGSTWNFGGGDWIVNQGGSGGGAVQLPAGVPLLLLLGAAAWFLLKR